ncbi:TetR/AcrR family transcriptional regulator [Acinetobacter sp. MB5]|uniref:TetR/AcrR family transcriptional regulator n=1 Tax=Acinetobacter sp. MB5 TaxID=2069438 RepID=UPI000DD027D7|nr:TetR/AcrR family transcriptional regulator [Acinetobacter sp. MB5]
MPKPNVKEKILEAGLHLIHQNGFNGCSVQDITSFAGVPKGSFYNHFASKDELALYALDRFWTNGEERRDVLKNNNIEPVVRLHEFFNLLTKAIINNNYENGCLIGNMSTELAIHPVFRDRLTSLYESWKHSVEQCVQEAQDKKQIKVNLPAASIADFLINSWEGATMRAKVEMNSKPFEEFDQIIFSSLFA